MKNLILKSILSLFLSTSLILLAQSAQAEAQSSEVIKKSPYTVIPETIKSKEGMTLVLLSDDLIKNLIAQQALYVKSDSGTQKEIINSIQGLLYLESTPQDELNFSYCEITAQEYIKYRQIKDKEIDPEIAQLSCELLMDNAALAEEIVKTYYLDSGNSDNLNRKISRIIRTNILGLIDSYMKENTNP